MRRYLSRAAVAALLPLAVGCASEPRLAHNAPLVPAPSPPSPARVAIETAHAADLSAPPERPGFRLDAPGAATPAAAASGQLIAPRRPVNVILDRAPVAAAADAVLAQTLQRPYHIEPGVTGEVSVRLTGQMTEAEILQALDQALRSAGAALADGGGGGLQVVPASKAPSFSPLTDGGGGAYYAGGTAVYKARNVSAAEIARVLTPLAAGRAEVRSDAARELVFVSGDPGTVSSLVRSAELFDIDWLHGRSFQFYPLRYASSRGVVEDVDRLLGGPQGPVGSQVELIEIDRLNAIIVAAKSPALLDQTIAWIERLDQPASPSERRLRVVKLSNLVAEDFVKVVSDLFAKGPPIPGTVVGPSRSAASDAAVTADPSSNSILMYADDAQYQSLLSVVRQLDVTPTQVLIEATVAEVTLNDQLRFGVQFYIDSHQVSGGFSSTVDNAVASVFPGFSVRYLGNDFHAVLNALSAVTDVQLVSTPKMLVLANQTAKLQVGNQVPIITQTAQGTDTTSRIVDNVTYRDTGVVLTVTPRVGEGGRIFIDIQQEVSDVTPTTTSNIDSPTIQQRKFSTQVQVEDGQVVSLGGLISTADTKTVSGVPYLSRAPLVGPLFRDRNDQKRQTELVVFLKPHLIQSRADADRVTDEISQRLRALGMSHAHG